MKYVCILLLGIGTFSARAQTVKTINLNSESVAKVQISTEGTVLSFPVKPTDVVLGRKGAFGLTYIKNDISISPLGMGASSNLFVYLEGRRFSFHLTTAISGGYSVILIRDAAETLRARVIFDGK